MKSVFASLIVSASLFFGGSKSLAQTVLPHAYAAVPSSVSDVKSLENWLKQPYSANFSLSATDTMATPWSQHIHFDWLIEGIPVHRAKVVWNTPIKGKSYASFPVMPTHLNLDRRQIAIEVTALFRQQLDWPSEVVRATLCWVLGGYSLELHWLLEVDAKTTVFEVLINRDGEVVEEHSLALHQKDTTVAVNLYLPDPVTVSAAKYGDEGFVDDDDQASDELIAAMRQDTITLAWDETGGFWHLASPYAIAVDIDSPGVKPPTIYSLDASQWLLTRSDPHFEYFNAFYHLNLARKHNASLGFTDLVNYPLPFDAHGSLADQSTFVASPSMPYLKFGDGGVDDAEDADVIVHEYGHAMGLSATPGTNFGAERNALEEGVCDYFAVSHSRRMHVGNRNTVFDWDGHNEFWGGRSFTDLRTYPSDLENNLYQDGIIWASALGEIADYIGESNTDQVVIQSIYSWFSDMTMTNAGRLLLQADTLINGGENAELISMVLCARGLLSGCEDTLVITTPIDLPYLANTYDFAYNQEPLYLYPNGKKIIALEWFDLSGKLIYEEAWEKSADRFYIIEGERLNPGMFVLRITTNEGVFSYKLVRLWTP